MKSLFLLFLLSTYAWADGPKDKDPELGHLLDGFEKDLKWEVKEWGDGAKLEVVDDAATEGKRCLRASFAPNTSKGQKKFFLRRELRGKAQDLREVQLDIFNPLPVSGIDLAIAIEADQYYETDKVSLKQGWNKGVRFRVDDKKLKSKATNWEYTTGVPESIEIGSIYLIIYTGEANAGSFQIDNLRSAGKPVLPPPNIKVAPRIASAPRWKGVTVLSPEPHTQFGLYEIGVSFDAVYNDPFDSAEILLEAQFTSPSGRVQRVEGFLYSGEVTRAALPKKADWRVRFTPSEAGTWTYTVSVVNPKGRSQSPQQTFTVKAGTSDGFVRVDAKDRDYFAFDSGRFFYPIGQNAAWDSQDNYRKLFPVMKANRENWTRLWMSHWSFGIEWKEMGHFKGIGNYNLENAQRLDEIVSLMQANDIYAQLVFEFHGALSSKVNPEWPNNPYNKAQGGSLQRAQDFFTDRAVRELYKRRIRYIVARWGYSPHIMAWELFNEISFADDFSLENDYAWHKEMSAWLKSIDPYKHLITTSYYDSYNKKTFALPTIDFTQYHAYHQQVWKTMVNVVPRFKAFGKPFFFGEFGSDSGDGVDAQDKQGVFLHAGIWTQAMQPVAGNAMPWWWDTLIEPNQLYKHFAALGNFLDGLDRRGQSWTSRQEKWPVLVKGKQRETLAFYGLESSAVAMGWICDVKGMKYKDRAAPQEFRALQFYISPAKPGRYRVEYWDTILGKVIGSEEEQTDRDGRLLLSLPPFKNDLAFKAYPLSNG